MMILSTVSHAYCPFLHLLWRNVHWELMPMPKARLQRFTPIFTSKRFIILPLTFRPMTCFELICVSDVREEIIPFFCMWLSRSPNLKRLLKKLFLPIELCCQKSIRHKSNGLFMDSISFHCSTCPFLGQYHTALNVIRSGESGHLCHFMMLGEKLSVYCHYLTFFLWGFFVDSFIRLRKFPFIPSLSSIFILK